MIKITIICSMYLLMCSCATKNIITVKSPIHTEKESLLMQNNKLYSQVTVVGGGSKIIEDEKLKLKKRTSDRNRNILLKVQGVDLSSIFDKDGNEQLKATMQGDILFVFDKYELNESSVVILKSFYNAITEIQNKKIEIIGHTDNIGDNHYNEILSLNRANEVRKFLIDKGYQDSLISVQGRGDKSPIDTNSTPEGRSKNRRVEIIINN